MLVRHIYQHTEICTKMFLFLDESLKTCLFSYTDLQKRKKKKKTEKDKFNASFQITDSVLSIENRGGLYYLTNVTTIVMTSRVSQPVWFGAKRISRDTISLGALINNYCYGKSQVVIPATSSLFTYVRNQMANNSRFIRVNCRH